MVSSRWDSRASRASVQASLGIVAVVLAACVGAGGTDVPSDGSHSSGHGFDVVRVDVGSGEVEGWGPLLPGQNNTLAVAAAGGHVFITTVNGVVALPATDRGASSGATTIRTDGAPYDVTVGHHDVWAAGAGYTAWRIDPRRERVSAELQLQDSREHSVASDRRYVWMANFRTGVIQRIDPRVDALDGRLTVPGGIATDITTGFGWVWVIDGLEDAVDRIDPATLRITKVAPLPGTGTAIATGADGVWVAEDREGTILQFDPTTGRVRRAIHVGRDAPGLSVGFGSLWITHRDGTLTRFPLSGGPRETVRVTPSRGPLAGVAVDRPRRAVWVTVCPPGLACGLVGQRAGGHGK
jgi:hypothetical protein